MTRSVSAFLIATFCCTALGTPGASIRAAEADPLDWTYWRGPEFNGVSRETGLLDKWNPRRGKAGNVLWKRDDLGGRSTPVVMHGKVYTLCRAEQVFRLASFE